MLSITHASQTDRLTDCTARTDPNQYAPSTSSEVGGIKIKCKSNNQTCLFQCIINVCQALGSSLNPRHGGLGFQTTACHERACLIPLIIYLLQPLLLLQVHPLPRLLHLRDQNLHHLLHPIVNQNLKVRHGSYSLSKHKFKAFLGLFQANLRTYIINFPAQQSTMVTSYGRCCKKMTTSITNV